MYNHNKIIYLLLGLFICGGGIMLCKKQIAYDVNDGHKESMHHILNADGSYSAPLEAIIEKTGIITDGSLADLVAKTQRLQPDGGWLRPQNLERWELAYDHTLDVTWYVEQFSKMGFIDAVVPCKKHYRYAVVFGATIQGMRERFAYLLKLLECHEISVDEIIFFVGQRLRDATKESLEVLFEKPYPDLPFDPLWQKPNIVPATETELAYLIIAQAAIPAALKETIVVIDAPMIVLPDGTAVRPTTDSTVETWLVTEPEFGPMLCISSQPHIERQLYVAERLLPGWDIECVGPAMGTQSPNLFMLLDTLARTLWELNKVK